MENIVATLLLVVAAFLLFALLGFAAHKKRLRQTIAQAEADAQKVLAEARANAERLIQNSKREVKEEGRKRRQLFEDEAKVRRQEVAKLENKIRQREQSLDKKLVILDDREKKLEELNENLRKEEQRFKHLNVECEGTLEQARQTLQKISGMTPEDAKHELIKSMESEARKVAAEKIRQIEEDTKREADQRSRAILSSAVQRLTGEYVNDSTVTVVSIPSDEMKGRIIGREGRNIRAIEQATGVDLIIDDTPEAVIVSCFNPIRREVAKITLERLIADGRIHPARIEETAKRVVEEFDTIMSDQGEQAAFDVGITDLHPDLIKYLGRLRYRTCGQQSVLQHSMEVANICQIMAAEMGINIKRAKRAGLLHDIGKAVDQETEGHHSDIGANLCEKYGEHTDVVQAIRLHHADDLTHGSPYAVVVHAANLLSTNRPGARKELLEGYIQRLDNMEKLIKDFPGIENAFVLQAGREVRALVQPTGISDSEVGDLSNDIAAKLRAELTFPGQVRVTVVRESQAVEFAK